MEQQRYDVAVVGLGAMGSAAAAHLAARGLSVAGFDRYTPPHAFGSHAGDSRIIRSAYAEGTEFMPLLLRSWELWEELEDWVAATGRRMEILRVTGVVDGGAPGNHLVAGARASAAAFGVACVSLDAAGLADRVPLLRLDGPCEAVWEPRAGALIVANALRAHLAQARAAGARLFVGEAVDRWTAPEDGRPGTVATAQRTITADAIVLAAGAWLPDLVRADLPLTVERQVQVWFAPHGAELPVVLWAEADGRVAYAVPDVGRGVKAAVHHAGATTAADTVSRDVTDADIGAVRAWLARRLPDLDGEPVDACVCLYTNTPDERFIVDRHPQYERVIVVSACSGHGFKFAPAVGEAVADIVTSTAPAVDLRPFRAGRFSHSR